MAGIYFLDIPVYRLSEDRYYSEMHLFIDEKMYPGPPEHDEIMKRFHSRSPDQERSFREHLRAYYGGAWDYNEIIGYIQLHFLGTQIRGEYWQIKGKRIQRTRRKVFEWRTWKLAHEIDISTGASNSEIYALIREYLADCARELKGRHIDVRRLEAIGPYVDWRGLLGHLPSSAAQM
jgi:hypothetical protein